MIIDNLRGRCVTAVARDIARGEVPRDCNTSEWLLAVEACKDEAVERINAMSNIELLNVISEVLLADD